MRIDDFHEEMTYSLSWDYSYCIFKKMASERNCAIYSLKMFKCQVKDISPFLFASFEVDGIRLMHSTRRR